MKRVTPLLGGQVGGGIISVVIVFIQLLALAAVVGAVALYPLQKLGPTIQTIILPSGQNFILDPKALVAK